MIHLVLLALAALHLQDPIGDAVGDGSLAPPTAPVYADLADFDLERVTLEEGDVLRVRVAMGGLGNPADLPEGFSNAVLEVYLDTAPGGSETLLPGSGMRMPSGIGWDVALRLTGDGAFVVRAQPGGDPAGWPRREVEVRVDGNALVVDTGLPRPRNVEAFAVAGLYDPFAADAWRAVSAHPSPWAFSSATQRRPVVDVLAHDAVAQERAIDEGVLPRFRARAQGLGWLVLMVAGLMAAAGGLMLRRRVASRPSAAAAAAATTDEAGAGPMVAPDRLAPNRSPLEHVADTFLDDATEAALWPDAEEAVARAAGDAAGRPAGSGRGRRSAALAVVETGDHGGGGDGGGGGATAGEGPRDAPAAGGEEPAAAGAAGGGAALAGGDPVGFPPAAPEHTAAAAETGAAAEGDRGTSAEHADRRPLGGAERPLPDDNDDDAGAGAGAAADRVEQRTEAGADVDEPPPTEGDSRRP